MLKCNYPLICWYRLSDSYVPDHDYSENTGTSIMVNWLVELVAFGHPKVRTNSRRLKTKTYQDSCRGKGTFFQHMRTHD